MLDIAATGCLFRDMISRVTIANYKSIEAADFEARRVNVFIGEPNSGKSNLLEAVGFLSPGVFENLHALFRIQQPADLFWDREIERPISVNLQPLGGWMFGFERERGNFGGQVNGLEGPLQRVVQDRFSFEGRSDPRVGIPWPNAPIRYYRYRGLDREEWTNSHYGSLRAPFGANLPNLLLTNRAIRDSISAFFKSKDFRLELRPQDNEILISKEVDDVLYSFPFEAISETMKRIVFYKAALESNNDAVLVLDEPEANTFPVFTKYLAERIALDETNQFFLSTHNPYVLMSIIEKTPVEELAVYVTRMKNYRTELRMLQPEELSEALDLGMSIFFNLDQYFAE